MVRKAIDEACGYLIAVSSGSGIAMNAHVVSKFMIQVFPGLNPLPDSNAMVSVNYSKDSHSHKVYWTVGLRYLQSRL